MSALKVNEVVVVERKDLIVYHDALLTVIHRLRRQLNYPPLLTGHQKRELTQNANR